MLYPPLRIPPRWSCLLWMHCGIKFWNHRSPVAFLEIPSWWPSPLSNTLILTSGQWYHFCLHLFAPALFCSTWSCNLHNLQCAAVVAYHSCMSQLPTHVVTFIGKTGSLFSRPSQDSSCCATRGTVICWTHVRKIGTYQIPLGARRNVESDPVWWGQAILASLDRD